MSEAALIWSTFGDEATAREAANTLLDEGLVVCANLFPDVQSLYVWRGKKGEAGECGALFKTAFVLLSQAIERLEAIHPYQSPAILGVEASSVGRATKEWISGMSGEAAP